MPRTIACGARSLYKGEKWRPEGTCPTPDSNILIRLNAIFRVDAHAACERHQQKDENSRVWDFNQELALASSYQPPTSRLSLLTSIFRVVTKDEGYYRNFLQLK